MTETEQIVHFVSLGYGELRMAKKFATKETLEKLFQSEGGIIVVDPNGEEVYPPVGDNDHYDIDSALTYTVVSEEDLRSDTEDDDNDQDSEPTEEEEYKDEDNIDEDDYDDDDDIDCDDDLLLANQVDGKLKIHKDVRDPSTSANEENHRMHEHNEQCQQHRHQQHEDKKDCCDHDHNDHDHEHAHTNNTATPHANNNDNGFNKLLKMREERIKMIREFYTRLHPNIFKLEREYFEESFIKAIDDFKASGCKNYSALDGAFTKLTDTRIYSIRIFNRQFCDKLREEVENFRKSGLPSTKPNSMNNYGLILDEIGFTELFTDLRENYLKYFTSYLYPDYNGADIDSHHAFIVQYKMNQDKDLGFHYDESDVTVNICLSDNFTGSSLYFKGILEKEDTHNENFEYNHSPGQCIMHIGHHRHGANGLTGGERSNLILWLRSINKAAQSDVCASSAHSL
ncbi:putative prolyl 4-hydroxylase alpha subunit [Cavenderia fasciculata]|uniref:Prolyl 4-hydroxylase alpha subunit n=1 Tax=Cavenderia fasciculata TaxID=261658 RepID=F4PP35_CACFS|nr:putative prolyl 4-hydroxylase alpha subunit [Cavenderia fasciculata]EGG22148.1 putative prolyl 4-hydroxylase alpha subunit [Cavenderia fasciculata]|eukprot:XP_004359999.1 putative prolyl 4-hydroxylase alpha subunit [Cavenderia fasciculata]